MDKWQLKNKNSLHSIGVILFVLGISLGLILFGMIAWAKLESDFYFGYSYQADEPLMSMSCPHIMTFSETKPIIITLKNPTQKVVSPMIEVDISNHGVYRTIRTQPSIAPGETQVLNWDVTSDDVEFGHLILVKVFVFSVSVLPSREGTCGILVVNFPVLSGNLLFISLLTLSLISIFVWAGIWIVNQHHMKERIPYATSGMFVLAIIVIAGIIISLLGAWLPSLCLFAVAILLIASYIAYLLRSM
jgi:hypothetical protein